MEKEQTAMTLEDLLSFSHFQKHFKNSSDYGYGGTVQEMRKKEFSRTADITYLDHIGATLFPESLLHAFMADLSENVYGNPHSSHLSSRLTHDTIEHVRYRILQHFNTSSEDYTVVFTSGSTAALKLVAENFPWTPRSSSNAGSHFCYLTDNHTSVVGIRGMMKMLSVPSVPVAPEDLIKSESQTFEPQNDNTFHLFCYPALSNFSGTKYPLSWIKKIQSGKMFPITVPGKWVILLDAASFVSTSPLDLAVYQPDLVTVSFYKIFGFPTGLGALIVSNRFARQLRKNYFGGGTAAAYLSKEDFYVPKESISNRFEDGTISFLDIIALKHGFDTLQRLTGGMENIRNHTHALASYTYSVLSALHYANGQPVARIYTDTEVRTYDVQGPIINFNVLDETGGIIGYSQVDKLASLYNIHFRTGCFCNAGACQKHLGISNAEVKSNLQAGHVCGDDMDLVNGRPTGSVFQWPVAEQGLLFDRNWMIVNENGVCLSQKQEPRLCLICPSIDMMKDTMIIQAKGMSSIEVPLHDESNMTAQICQNKVCGDRVHTYDCGEEVAQWLSHFLARKCRLIRQSSSFHRYAGANRKGPVDTSSPSLSLVNEAQYLLVNTASVLNLSQQIPLREGKDNADGFQAEQMIQRFRANLVIDSNIPFQEEEWNELFIGCLHFKVSGKCTRCQIICINQTTGEKKREVLQTLSSSREGKTTFGMYLLNSPCSSYPSLLTVGSEVYFSLRNPTEDCSKE
ncbi:molybdenum cofactor sulfurase isoform X2 [Dendropsophus ebraccatus]|uniref:molybdenum cofactor sulfurase isoform X2 n=1 Tax=Dendropsophus ebraccatus TaxID=150705 RepID=UPI003831904C